MIFLEQLTNLVLSEEGQVIIQLHNMKIDWNILSRIFEDVYYQSRDWLTVRATMQMNAASIDNKDIVHVSKMTVINQRNMVKQSMPLDRQFYDFNPYTKESLSIYNQNMGAEVIKYPKLDYLPVELDLTNACDEYDSAAQLHEHLQTNVKKTSITYFSEGTSHNINGQSNGENVILQDNNIDLMIKDMELTGTMKNVSSLKFHGTSKYKGILELDLSERLFVVWFKAALFGRIGGIKNQTQLAGLPFQFDSDNILQRARELQKDKDQLMEELSHWMNY